MTDATPDACPVCDGRGTNTKTYHYREHPGGIGDANTKGAAIFPAGSGELIPRTVEETCHFCGGTGRSRNRLVLPRREEVAS